MSDPPHAAPDWHLTIGRARSLGHPDPEGVAWKRITGGPEHLLGWLEDQLALGVAPAPPTTRIAGYADALAEVMGASYRASFETDRWATAAELLTRRDELLLAGWDGTGGEEPPPLVGDLAAAEEHFQGGSGVADRLRRVKEALARGQTLPPHRLELEEPPREWPAAWRPVLERITWEEPPDSPSAATPGSALERIQTRLSGVEAEPLVVDESVQWMSSSSAHLAAQLMAAALGTSPDMAGCTVFYAPDPGHAAQIEEAFLRLGMPAAGTARSTDGHPVHQVLPIAVELCWKPVDPRVLMDLFSLPVGPIPRRVARRLARALSEFPGLGSRTWDEEWSRLEEEYPDEAERAAEWLFHRRANVGEPVSSELVARRCGRVARWARGYAEVLDGEGESPELARALIAVHSEASALKRLVEGHEGELSRPQLQRMLDDVRGASGAFVPRPAEAGGPLIVSSLADVPEWCVQLTWIGTGTEETVPARWTRRQLRTLRAAGIELDDGQAALRHRRAAERRGLRRVRRSLLMITLPEDEQRRRHPLWSRILDVVHGVEEGFEPTPSRILFERPWRVAIWTVLCEEVRAEHPQPRRPEWHVQPDLLSRPESTSATEMQGRLACPLRWVLRRVARIRPSRSASLPDDFRLRGLFAHALLEDLFQARGGKVPAPDEAVREVVARFDDRLPLDAAPLAQPDRVADRRRFRDEIAGATRVLVEALRDGGYRSVRTEATVDAELDGRPLRGRIDCLVEGDPGEAVVDFKYVYGDRRYRDWLRDGTAVQLAVYAFARSAGGGAGRPMPAVAYAMLRQGRIHTPEGSPLAGVSDHDVVEGAPSIAAVWDSFRDALGEAEGWLDGDEPLPVRPLQDAGDWPDGVEMVLDPDSNREPPDVWPCRYCDYQVLCGARECR